MVGPLAARERTGLEMLDNNILRARGWQALAHERKQRGVLSAVQYRERGFDQKRIFDECFRLFIEDAQT